VNWKECGYVNTVGKTLTRSISKRFTDDGDSDSPIEDRVTDGLDIFYEEEHQINM
jgi:hypothetical protein